MKVLEKQLKGIKAKVCVARRHIFNHPYVSYRKGFTILELLLVISIVGIIAAIAAPTWTSYLESRQLTVERDKLYSAIRTAQINAQTRSISWQFSLRVQNGLIEWAVHPYSAVPDESQWQQLESSSVQIDAETTFAQKNDVYYVRFDEDGNVEYRLGRITLSSDKAPTIKRCVVVSTLIGAMRKAKENQTSQDGKFCY